MQLRAVVLAHGGGEASARHRGGAAGGAALGHLDDGNARFRAFKRGHGAGGAAADDQHVGLVLYDGNFEAIAFAGVVIDRCVGLSSGLADFDECVHAGIGERTVVDVQRHFVDARGLEVRLEGVHEDPIVLGTLPRALVVAVQDRARGAWCAR